ncbi:hypothetical protein GWK47_037675 [Chionoecetes opilio]|uniref:Uncharacterized protein n=1 Tax=Chionoecetes opilio TaxID=41210 RepID=A0A8J4YEP6_CHIOP|nr:hypothetical protein GWK47_037675 [Chionoecetes opilio]
MLPYPCPSDDGSGTSAPWLPVHRALPPPFLLRCLLGALPLVPLRRMPWDSPFFLRPVYWAPMPPVDCLWGRLTGGLFAIGRLEDGSWGPVPDLEVRRSRVDGGRSPSSPPDSFSRLNAPSKHPAVSSGARVSMLWPPYWLTLVWSGMASPCVEGTQDARWLSLGGPRPVALDKGPAWTLPKVESSTTSVNRGPSQSGAPDPGSPGLWWLSTCDGLFPPGVPFFSPKDLPWRAQPGLKEELFRRDFQERQHASLLTSSVPSSVSWRSGSPPSPWITLSLPAPRVGCLSGFVDRL